ncbi:MAG TPA: elongation factor 1-beta [Nitrososphaeraceae archaeon]|jgi:elongation factor 1-beta
MTRLVARIKILPAEADTDLNKLVDMLSVKIPNGMELKTHVTEPIAFGVSALLGDFLIDDKEGQMDMLEESIKNTEGVGEIDVVSVSRQSVRMK